MSIFFEHLFDWIILVSLIIGAIYTMKVIGQEKTSFKDECYEVEFFDFSMMIPNWWTLTSQEETLIKFQRTDTRYDWYAIFSYHNDGDEKPLDELLKEKFDLEKVEFDMDVTFETDSRVLFKNPQIQEEFQEIIRVEGKASQNIVDRIYYDIYLVRRLNHPGYFIFESKSSVLNGLVEGPYFEESLTCLSFIHKT